MSSDIPIRPIHLNPRTKHAMSLWFGQVQVDGRWTMPEILVLVSQAYGLSIEELKGEDRQRRIAWPRQHAMWLMTQQRHLSLPMIGRFMGGRDHTTVIHGRDAFAQRWAAMTQAAEAA